MKRKLQVHVTINILSILQVLVVDMYSSEFEQKFKDIFKLKPIARWLPNDPPLFAQYKVNRYISRLIDMDLRVGALFKRQSLTTQISFEIDDDR